LPPILSSRLNDEADLNDDLEMGYGSIILLMLSSLLHADRVMASQAVVTCEQQIKQLNSLVKIHTRSQRKHSPSKQSHSSGVVIGKDLVVTVAHGLAQGSDIFVSFNRAGAEVTEPAKLLHIYSGYDLSLLAVETADIEPMNISKASYLGQRLWSMGFNSHGELVTTSGKLLQKKFSHLLSSNTINPGQSGGALLLCEQGRLVLSGILQAYRASLIDGRLINKQQSKSIPASVLKSFIASEAD
jgi:S1-C subfamily serine protease